MFTEAFKYYNATMGGVDLGKIKYTHLQKQEHLEVLKARGSRGSPGGWINFFCRKNIKGRFTERIMMIDLIINGGYFELFKFDEVHL